MLYVYIFSSIFVLLFLRTNYICRDLILYITLPISYLTSVQYHHHAFSGVVFFFIITSFQMGAGYCQAKANVIRVGARNHEAAKFGSIHV